jgi:large subunit ribosomal protein L15e
MKGLYYNLKEAWKNQEKGRLRNLIVQWRKDNAVTKLDKPTRLDRARSLGYKAKRGFVITRVRVMRGGHKRPKPVKGRKTRKQTNKKVLNMSYRWIAENRAQKKFRNLEVLNSYKLAKDGKYYFYEVILVDPQIPEIKNDKTIKWIIDPANKNRVLRGLTSAGKKSRGLRSKNPMNKFRPSVRSGKRRQK